MPLFSASHPEGQSLWRQLRLLPTNRFIAVMQKMTDLFWFLSPTGQMQEPSPSWLSFTGQQEHEASGMGWLDAVYAADRSGLEALFAQPLSANRWLERECYIRRNDGIYRLLRLRLFPVSTSAAMVYEVVVSGVDMTVEHLSDAQTKLAMQTLGVGLWQYDLALQQFVATDQWRQLYGLSPDAPLSLHAFLALVYPNDRARIEDTITHLRSEHAISEDQFRIIRPDGHLRWLMSRVQYLADPSNQAGYLIGSTVDVTELKAEQERTTEILESITDGFLHLDAQWRITQANDRIGRLTSLKWRDCLGQSLWEIRPEWRGTFLEGYLRTAMASRQPLSFEWFSPSLDIWSEIHLYPAKQEGLWAYVTDITERKHAQAALQEREQQFRRLIDSNIVGIAVHDLEAHIYEANDAFLALIGYSRTEFFEQHLAWSDLAPQEYRASSERAFQELARTGTVSPRETALRRKDGSLVPVLIGGTIYRREAASPLGIVLVVDLIAQKALDQQKDLMLSFTSHELKTPLAVLKGALQLLERRTQRVMSVQESLPEALSTFFEGLTKCVQDSLRQVDVQTHLIDDLLDVSQITAGILKLEMGRCDLVSLVHETVNDLRVSAPERSLVLNVPQQREVWVLADRERISEVVTNYITNAVHYSPADQPIIVGLTLEETTARVWVRDQGPGLTAEEQKRVWLRHHRIEGVSVQAGFATGLGLGLYICQTLIRQQRGDVGVESAPGKGSTFWFTLPLMT